MRPRGASPPVIRHFVPDDVEAVSRLRQRAFGAERSLPLDDLMAHFREVFFRCPWSDPKLCSLVEEDRNGSIVGFIGLVPRPMVFRGERIRAGVATQLMVDPERATPLSAPRLLGHLFRSDHDLILSDGSTPTAARIWTARGGERVWLQSFKWMRSLRPGREILRFVEERRPRMGRLAVVGLPALSLADAAFARMPPNRFHAPGTELVEEPVTPEALAASLSELAPRILRMEYDTASIRWVLKRLREKKRHGELAGSLLRDRSGRAVGWYLFYVPARGGISEVVRVAARPNHEEEVLARLLTSAWKAGASAVRGAMDRRFAIPVQELHGRFQVGAPWTLCHSPRPEILAALQRGDAGLSRMDMEFWMRFTVR